MGLHLDRLIRSVLTRRSRAALPGLAVLPAVGPAEGGARLDHHGRRRRVATRHRVARPGGLAAFDPLDRTRGGAYRPGGGGTVVVELRGQRVNGTKPIPLILAVFREWRIENKDLIQTEPLKLSGKPAQGKQNEPKLAGVSNRRVPLRPQCNMARESETRNRLIQIGGRAVNGEVRLTFVWLCSSWVVRSEWRASAFRSAQNFLSAGIDSDVFAGGAVGRFPVCSVGASRPNIVYTILHTILYTIYGANHDLFAG